MTVFTSSNSNRVLMATSMVAMLAVAGCASQLQTFAEVPSFDELKGLEYPRLVDTPDAPRDRLLASSDARIQAQLGAQAEAASQRQAADQGGVSSRAALEARISPTLGGVGIDHAGLSGIDRTSLEAQAGRALEMKQLPRSDVDGDRLVRRSVAATQAWRVGGTPLDDTALARRAELSMERRAEVARAVGTDALATSLAELRDASRMGPNIEGLDPEALSQRAQVSVLRRDAAGQIIDASALTRRGDVVQSGAGQPVTDINASELAQRGQLGAARAVDGGYSLDAATLSGRATNAPPPSQPIDPVALAARGAVQRPAEGGAVDVNALTARGNVVSPTANAVVDAEALRARGAGLDGAAPLSTINTAALSARADALSARASQQSLVMGRAAAREAVVSNAGRAGEFVSAPLVIDHQRLSAAGLRDASTALSFPIDHARLDRARSNQLGGTAAAVDYQRLSLAGVKGAAASAASLESQPSIIFDQGIVADIGFYTPFPRPKPTKQLLLKTRDALTKQGARVLDRRFGDRAARALEAARKRAESE